MMHILQDASGAYVDLDHGMVCSHLESLLDRVKRTWSRAELTMRARSGLWEEFDHASVVEATPEYELRKTLRSVIFDE